MPPRPRPEQPREPSEGGYAVFHERPYPHRLDRVFRIAAVVVGGAVAVAFALWLHVTGGQPITTYTAFASIGVGLIPALLAYGFTRAVGMIVVGVYGGTRPKAYVIDWEERPPG